MELNHEYRFCKTLNIKHGFAQNSFQKLYAELNCPFDLFPNRELDCIFREDYSESQAQVAFSPKLLLQLLLLFLHTNSRSGLPLCDFLRLELRGSYGQFILVAENPDIAGPIAVNRPTLGSTI
jgi:hypothetical protein